MDYYTPEEVAAKLKLSVQTIWKYLREGRLPASKIARGYRISDEQLDRFMRSLEPGKHGKPEEESTK